MRGRILLLLLTAAVCGHADSIRPEWAVGFNDATVDDGAKLAALQLPGRVSQFEYAWEAGGWFDRSAGRRNAAFLDVMAGLEPQTDRFYVRYLLGPALISGTDEMLGSNFQVAHDVAFGVRDRRGVRLGLEYRHFSNAGIVRPNEGRDFIGFQAEWRVE